MFFQPFTYLKFLNEHAICTYVPKLLFVAFIVILNTILLSITYYGMSDELEFLLDEISG